MLQGTVFINKIRMLQQTIFSVLYNGKFSLGKDHLCFSCALHFLYFLLGKDGLWFSNLYVQCIKVKLILYYFYTYIFYFVLCFSCLNGCVRW